MGGMLSSDPYLEGGVVIDVRSQSEWDSGHVEGAILIPHTIIKDKIGEYVKDKDTPINLYCAAGSRAGSAKSVLTSMGYTHVSNLGGYSSAKNIIPPQKTNQ